MASETLPVNFIICEAAKRGIEKVRAEYDKNFPDDPAAVACIGWATTILNSGPRSENVFVGFYQQSMLADIAHGIQETSGIKLVFFTTPEYHGRFAGKALDFDEKRGFFLRSP